MVFYASVFFFFFHFTALLFVFFIFIMDCWERELGLVFSSSLGIMCWGLLLRGRSEERERERERDCPAAQWNDAQCWKRGRGKVKIAQRRSTKGFQSSGCSSSTHSLRVLFKHAQFIWSLSAQLWTCQLMSSVFKCLLRNNICLVNSLNRQCNFMQI